MLGLPSFIELVLETFEDCGSYNFVFYSNFGDVEMF